MQQWYPPNLNGIVTMFWKGFVRLSDNMIKDIPADRPWGYALQIDLADIACGQILQICLADRPCGFALRMLHEWLAGNYLTDQWLISQTLEYERYRPRNSRIFFSYRSGINYLLETSKNKEWLWAISRSSRTFDNLGTWLMKCIIHWAATSILEVKRSKSSKR